MKHPTDSLSVNIALPDEAATLELGARLSKRLKRGDVVCLNGGLGAGKTTLSRGLIYALTGQDEVPSPTYTLVQTYDAPDFEIWHFDLYRLKSPSEVWALGIEDALYDGVCLIEWPERLGDLKPSGTIDMTIEFEGDGRAANITYQAAIAERFHDL